MESKMEVLQKIKKEGLNDDQKTKIYSFATLVSRDTRREICPALYNICLNSERGLLKNELGRVIFHLAKNEKLNTVIGLGKLLDASIQVAPEETFKVLESADEEAKDLAERIKSVL